eukprot:Plantae.Rhodophyta-Purpureofilum_apyrenoidigerum.ctg9727.p1 GENE.Plantae.Rhodophyta-Purpureofilum_apyrenoidigerum.ctg9727~~Plantae.Rhodophyta-Purpureofilum_apyrenoidigerum.ctg9727.p1  ORF type:complete len:251 (-),score=61.90 Plantae.Rhodophyta-Purpureofilum_apyrenoidigerum.ctg9727:491-1243(-)
MDFVGPVCFVKDEERMKACGRARRRAEVKRGLRSKKNIPGKTEGNGSDSRRPHPGSLQGKFLPTDSQPEDDMPDVVADEEFFDSYGDIREGLPRTGLEPAEVKKWNKRAEAAKKRWANPDYRKKMMEKRRQKKEGRERIERKHRVQIGSMDSVTLSSDQKAREINAYAQSNKLRSEKLEKLHQNKEKWMQERLESGTYLRDRFNNDDYKRQKQLERKQLALERAKKKKQNAAQQKNARESQHGSQSDESK